MASVHHSRAIRTFASTRRNRRSDPSHSWRAPLLEPSRWFRVRNPSLQNADERIRMILRDVASDSAADSGVDNARTSRDIQRFRLEQYRDAHKLTISQPPKPCHEPAGTRCGPPAEKFAISDSGRSFAESFLPIVSIQPRPERLPRPTRSLIRSQPASWTSWESQSRIKSRRNRRGFHDQGWLPQVGMGRSRARRSGPPRPITDPRGGAGPRHHPRTARGESPGRCEAGADRLALHGPARRESQRHRPTRPRAHRRPLRRMASRGTGSARATPCSTRGSIFARTSRSSTRE